MADDSRDFDGEATLAAALPESELDSFVLEFIEGPNQGARVQIEAGAPLVLGKDPSADIRLDDRSVSRRHAELAVDRERGGLRLRDLDSTNGTRVNGVRVQSALLRPGAIVRVGASAIRVCPSFERQTGARTSFGRYLGQSPALQRLYPLLDRLAHSDVPVVIEGETGTGKELLAESLHEAGPRANGPYVVLDCTTVPASLMEAELFGNEAGAFTGATRARRGLFEQAAGGTLLIDEIGELDLALQPKLLRAIERGEFRRIGSEKWQRVSLRVIAATRRKLSDEVRAGRFRDDLYHRLAVGRVELPPLRDRRADIELLAERFWLEFGAAPDSLPRELIERWRDAPWPGNVRELRNAVARLVALGSVEESEPLAEAPDEAPATSARGLAERLADSDLPLPAVRLKLVAAFEKQYLTRMLEKHGGNPKAAAAAAGIGQRYFNMLLSGSRRRVPSDPGDD